MKHQIVAIGVALFRECEPIGTDTDRYVGLVRCFDGER